MLAGEAIYAEYCAITAHTYENKVWTLLTRQDVTGKQG